MQIRTKLTIQFIILVAGILFVALYFVYFEFKQMTEMELYGNLRSKALMTAEMVLHDEDKLESLDNDSLQDSTQSSLPFKDNVVIFNHQFQKIFAFDRSENGFGRSFFSNHENKEINTREGDSYVVGIKFISKKGNPYFIVAKSKLNIYQVDNLRNILVLTFFIIIFLVALGGWIYTGQALAPVAKIVTQVDNILPSNLQERLSTPKNQDEIGRLVSTFNSLLERIHKAFTLQKNFISNVSHELKNPIAVIISQIEVSLGHDDERSVTEYKTTLHSVLNDAYDLSETTENLLQLARLNSEQQQNIKLDTLRLDEILLLSRKNLLRTHKDYRISFDIVGTPDSETDLCVLGNEMLLRSAFSNLMDNCCKYSGDKSAVVKLILSKNQKKIIEIADHGDGISPDRIAILFQPFYRDPKHKHIKGTGIGLSLVDSILKLHKVPLKVISNEGEGTLFSMEF
jgi:signal transduction histidine kinase